MDEEVLCIEKNRLPEEWLHENAVIIMSWYDFVATCSKAGFCFVPRLNAENNPDWKQVIPQVVLQTADLSKTAVYRIIGNEKRLNGLWSTGIGGHVDLGDTTCENYSFGNILKTGMERELNEELIFRHAGDMPVFEGVISFNAGVGGYHIGILFRMITKNPGDYVPGPELSYFRWAVTDRIHAEHGLDIDAWSAISLQYLKGE